MIFEHEPPTSLPEIPLIKHVGIPTADCLGKHQKHLNACTASVHSNLGCVTLGILSVSMNLSLFSTVCATTFIELVNPRAFPTVPVVATTSHIALINCTHKEKSGNSLNGTPSTRQSNRPSKILLTRYITIP